ncbi:MAG: hypothetical protein K0R00_274 [Herbinix sp.]|jgi:hypothetical protein|nr:hypothetical protein [Herbinix sp.]
MITYLLKRYLHKSILLQRILGLFLTFKVKPANCEEDRVIFTKTPFAKKEFTFDLKLVVSDKIKGNARIIRLIDFKNNEIYQWKTKCPPLNKCIRSLYRNISPYKARYFDVGAFFYGIKKEHSAHMNITGTYICVTCGFYIQIIDVLGIKSRIFPGNYLDQVWMYCDTSSFSSDGQYCYTVRWTLEDQIGIIDNHCTDINCQILKVKLDNLEYEVLGNVKYTDCIHQICCSPDEKHLVITSFKQDLYLPYPRQSIYLNPKGYQKSHEKGIKPGKILTFDIMTKEYWYTSIPNPVPAHIEFDPKLPNVFYLSTHNMKTYQSTLFLEGNGAIYKLRIDQYATYITGCYQDGEFYRITQPEVFEYDKKTYIAVTNTPDKLDIIDCEKMDLKKRIIVSKSPGLNFSRLGSALAPESKNIYFSSNASEHGRYILLGSYGGFKLYDMDTEQLIDLKSILPQNTTLGLGHPRKKGS